MGTTLTGRENLTKYTFWLGPVGTTDKENTVLGTLGTSLKRYESGSN
jgi:hypothetical protein